jgi:chromosome segregation ATPase
LKKKKKKFLRHCQSKNETNSSTDSSTDLLLNIKNDVKFLELENKFLHEELFLMKQSKNALNNEISELKKSIKKYTVEADMTEKTITRLTNEKTDLNSQIQMHKTEIANLKEIISINEEREHSKNVLRSKINEGQAEIAKLKEMINIQETGKINNKDKLKELNS